jgi:hypothetical protein
MASAGLAGSSCDAGTCQLGAIACGSGAPVCQSLQPAPAGTQCGASNFCDNDGGCLPCQVGAACSLTAAPCFNGTQSCTGGAATCTVGSQKAPGSVCGANLVCAPDAGCIACQTNSACDAGLCFTASTACGTGIPTCAVTGALPVGTQATPLIVCTGDGGSNACAVGTSCDAGTCRVGAVSCGTGASACTFSGSSRASTGEALSKTAPPECAQRPGCFEARARVGRWCPR